MDHPHPIPAARARILYVEDDPGLRELITDLLTGEGHLIETAVDGQDGLDHLTAENATYDLLLTDIRMPRMNGIEMLRHLQGTAFRAPIVVFSAYDHDLYAHEIAGLTIAAYLPKGDMQQLINTVAALLPQRGA